MKYISIGFLLIGLALLGGILYHIDLTAVWGHLQEIGWWGIAGIVVLNGIITPVDVASWQLALPVVPLSIPWLYRLLKVRMVGEAISETTPCAFYTQTLPPGYQLWLGIALLTFSKGGRWRIGRE